MFINIITIISQEDVPNALRGNMNVQVPYLLCTKEIKSYSAGRFR